MEPATIIGAIVGIYVGTLALFGVLIGHLFGRVGKLEERVASAEGLVTKLREWALRMVALYLAHRKDDAPDPEPIPGHEN